MIIGESGVGKTSFVDLFVKTFEQKFFNVNESTFTYVDNRIIGPTQKLVVTTTKKEFKDRNNRSRSLKINLIDTPGWGNNLNLR